MQCLDRTFKNQEDDFLCDSYKVQMGEELNFNKPVLGSHLQVFLFKTNKQTKNQEGKTRGENSPTEYLLFYLGRGD